MSNEEILKLEIEQFVQYSNIYKVIDSLASTIGRNSVTNYLREKKISKIIIYGAGVLGRLFYDILEKNKDICVMGVIDKSGTKDYGFQEFIDIDELQNMNYDLIIITPLNAYKPIADVLNQRGITQYCYMGELIDYDGRKMIYENGIYI